MKIEIVNEFSNELFDAMNHLLPQLTNSEFVIEKEFIKNIIETENTYLFVVKDENESVVGMLTLVLFSIPTCKKAYIEDVVVDTNQRGNGVGRKLLNAAIAYSKEKGASRIELTSNPSRVAANKLYQNLGFQIRDTNFYRLQLE